jgi:toxin ParE1/3/4
VASRARRVSWSRGARDDLDSILAFIAEDSPEAAMKVLDVVLRLADSLSGLSERGRMVPEIANPRIREVLVYSYRLLYEITDSEVRLLALVHGARDFDRWRKGRGES